ncbi:c-type cytochrome, partial [Klebsiella pneumoniae]|nr:c-type cytochrome [Klebsiella pneumoniae]
FTPLAVVGLADEQSNRESAVDPGHHRHGPRRWRCQGRSGKAAVCGACHGPDGNSAAPNFPKLAGQGERYLLKQMHDIKSGNRTVL